MVKELRILGTKGTLDRVTEALAVAMLGGPATVQVGEPHEEDAFARSACFLALRIEAWPLQSAL
jgi:hypothetical protein